MKLHLWNRQKYLDCFRLKTITKLDSYLPKPDLITLKFLKYLLKYYNKLAYKNNKVMSIL